MDLAYVALEFEDWERNGSADNVFIAVLSRYAEWYSYCYA